jgi:hypothetical protein
MGIAAMAKRRQKHEDYFICACCGAEVKVGAPVCRECGASDEFGWDDGYWWDDEPPTGYASRDEDEEQAEYEEIIAQELPQHTSGRALLRRRVITVVAIVTCACFVLWMLARRP